MTVQDDHPSGAITIAGNRVGNVLSCFRNSPPPQGSGSTAAAKLGQCAAL